MLVSDMSGQLHEVPDDASLGWYSWAEAEPYQLGYTEFGEPEVFDGFGNPLGIAPLLAALIPAAASVLPGLLSSLFGSKPRPAPGLSAWSPAFGGYDAADYEGYGYGSQVVYDGYGNPVGSIPALQSLLPAITQAMPAITAAIPQVSRAIQQVLPHAQRVMQAMASPAGMPGPMPGPPMPPPMPMMAQPPMDPEDDEEPMEPEGPPPAPYSPPPRMMARRPVRRRAMRRRRRRF